MASKRTIKRIVLTTIWVAITGGVLTLLVAANNGKEQKHNCKDVRITIHGTGERYYISKEDITRQLRPEGEPSLIGQAIDRIDLAQLERGLEKNAWIMDAELYFDRSDELHVIVTERQPIARVFATNGSSFYIDSSGTRLPLLPHITARVPVITNYPSARRPLPKDSTVLQGVRKVVEYIVEDDFWSAQIAQIDITPVGGYELLPTVGNHIIRIGNHENLNEKLGKLMLLYRQVLSRTGFDKYSVLDIQYTGQVVAVHRGAGSNVDSAQLKRNIAALLHADQMMKGHTSAEVGQEKEPEANDVVAASAPTVKPEVPKPEASKPKPKAVAASKTKTTKAPERKKEEAKKERKHTQPASTQQKPKAVMPRKKG